MLAVSTMSISPALVLLLAATPFCVLAAVTDLRSMKILNTTNIGLFLAFVIVGFVLFALGQFPLNQYGLRLSQAAVMLVAGIILTSLGMMGGGDSKFIAAMAPFIALQDALGFLFLLSALSLLTVALHRGIGAIKPMQASLAGWKSWSAEKRKFPFGVTLGTALFVYLCLKAFRG